MKQVNNVDILELKKDIELVFVPTPNQRACKARFWKRMDFDPSMVNKVTLSGAVRITNNTQLNHWWRQVGFEDWFCNKDEAGERIEYLYMLWMDKAEELLLNPDANHNAIVQIGKIIANLSGREGQEKFMDESIQKMSKQQLQAFIDKAAPRLNKAEPDKAEVPDGQAE